MFKESCITEQTQYFFDNEERSYSGVLDCGNCSRYGSIPPSFCMSVCLFNRDGSDVVSFLVVSGDSGSDPGYLDLSAAHSYRGRHKSPFICFFSPLRSALWLHFRLAITHIHGPPHIYFVPNYFSVNLACQSRLNMAVITGRYESHVSIARHPNVNDWRHRNFHYGYNKIPKRETGMIECYKSLHPMSCRFRVE